MLALVADVVVAGASVVVSALVVVVFPELVVVVGVSVVVVVSTPHVLSAEALPLTINISELSHSVQFIHWFGLEAFVNLPFSHVIQTRSLFDDSGVET